MAAPTSLGYEVARLKRGSEMDEFAARGPAEAEAVVLELQRRDLRRAAKHAAAPAAPSAPVPAKSKKQGRR